MATQRYPVVVWEDHAGCHTAALVTPAGPGPACVAPTLAEALEDLRRQLIREARERGHLPASGLREVRLSRHLVRVRPAYHERGHTYPCEELVEVRVPCVQAVDRTGMRLALLPLLDEHFHFQDPGSLQSLVRHFVREHLQGLTPEDLATHLPPRSVHLEEVAVPAPRGGKGKPEEEAPEVLAAVAEPLQASRGRHRRAELRAWEREPEVAELGRRLLGGRGGGLLLLVGEAGSGKTTVLREAVRWLRRQEGSSAEPPACWLTSGMRLIAGMAYLGQWQQRLDAVVTALGQQNGVLCIENLLDLVRTGGQAPGESLAAYLLPALERGELRMVAEATPDELAACRRLLPALVEQGEVLELAPFTAEQALRLLERLVEAGRRGRKLEVARGVPGSVLRLFRRFCPYHAFPGRAAEFCLELLERGATRSDSTLTSTDAVRLFVEQAGLPERLILDEMPLHPEEVRRSLEREVLGQPLACEALVNLVTTFKAALGDPRRPLGVLLFCGPTGVGKTALARALTRYLFGHGRDDDRLVRLDLSEYAYVGAAERLLEQPDGQPGVLVRRLRQQPFSVVLLDEIEKAAPEVHDTLLTLMDEGRLTDQYGRHTSFQSAVVIMTSNLGAGAQESIGFGSGDPQQHESEVASFFRPEFCNRLDAVIPFHPLTPEVMRQITRKELAQVAGREGLRQAGLLLRCTDALVEHLAAVGFDRRYGARPLQRTIERLVVRPLARLLVEQPQLELQEVEADLGPGGVVVFSVVGPA